MYHRKIVSCTKTLIFVLLRTGHTFFYPSPIYPRRTEFNHYKLIKLRFYHSREVFQYTYNMLSTQLSARRPAIEAGDGNPHMVIEAEGVVTSVSLIRVATHSLHGVGNLIWTLIQQVLVLHTNVCIHAHTSFVGRLKHHTLAGTYSRASPVLSNMWPQNHRSRHISQIQTHRQTHTHRCRYIIVV